MAHSEDREAASLSAQAAARLLARAAEFDTSASESTSVTQLRAAAAEAGIAPHAFDAALQSMTRGTSPREGATVPRWVRICLLGVVDRRVAMVFYWLFATVMMLAPVSAMALRATRGTEIGMGVLLLSGWSFFSLWSTSRAIRWADRHGWDRLP